MRGNGLLPSRPRAGSFRRDRCGLRNFLTCRAIAIQLERVTDDLEIGVVLRKRNRRRKRARIDAEAGSTAEAYCMVVMRSALKLESRDSFWMEVDLVHDAGLCQHRQVSIDRVQADVGV